jgi:CheY-like chemotaxis protein
VISAPKTVLVVDDEPAVRWLLQQGLPKHLPDYQVATVGNGQEAIDYLNAYPVEVLVTDIVMPVMDGFELLAHVRSRHPNLPVVVLATMAPDDVTRSAPKLGAMHVIQKPATAETVARSVHEARTATARGRMAGVPLSTLLQLMQLERKTCSLLVSSGGRKGRLHFLSGDLVNAYAFELDVEGEEAARHLLALDKVTIDFERSLHNHVRQIHTPLSKLLLEVATDLDESDRTVEEPAPADLPPVVVVTPSAVARADVAPVDVGRVDIEPVDVGRVDIEPVGVPHADVAPVSVAPVNVAPVGAAPEVAAEFVPEAARETTHEVAAAAIAPSAEAPAHAPTPMPAPAARATLGARVDRDTPSSLDEALAGLQHVLGGLRTRSDRTSRTLLDAAPDLARGAQALGAAGAMASAPGATGAAASVAGASNALGGRPRSWSGRPDSNRRHLPWQGSALPAELLPRAEEGPARTPDLPPSQNNSSHRPTFAGSYPPTIIGAAVLNFRVRNGIGWVHRAKGTKSKNRTDRIGSMRPTSSMDESIKGYVLVRLVLVS